MAKPRHKGDTKTFEEMTFEEQAKSINAIINVLQRTMIHHVSASKTRVETRDKCLKQITRLLVRLFDKT